MSLDEAIERYWSTVIVPKGKKRSAQNTLYILERIREHFGPETPLEALTTPAITDWADRLLAAGLTAPVACRAA